MRVATKYVNLTRRFFAEKGVADYRIVESLGATEGAPGAGSAELIVDITTTGATLAANALKILDDGIMLRSEANLVASARAPWTDRAKAAATAVLTRIAAEEEARTSREVRAALDPARASALAVAGAGSRGHPALRPCARPRGRAPLPRRRGVRDRGGPAGARRAGHLRARLRLPVPPDERPDRAAPAADRVNLEPLS